MDDLGEVVKHGASKVPVVGKVAGPLVSKIQKDARHTRELENDRAIQELVQSMAAEVMERQSKIAVYQHDLEQLKSLRASVGLLFNSLVGARFDEGSGLSDEERADNEKKWVQAVLSQEPVVRGEAMLLPTMSKSRHRAEMWCDTLMNLVKLPKDRQNPLVWPRQLSDFHALSKTISAEADEIRRARDDYFRL